MLFPFIAICVFADQTNFLEFSSFLDSKKILVAVIQKFNFF